MGVGNNGMLFTPSGKELFTVPMWLARRVQIMQHFFARLTHKF